MSIFVKVNVMVLRHESDEFGRNIVDFNLEVGSDWTVGNLKEQVLTRQECKDQGINELVMFHQDTHDHLDDETMVQDTHIFRHVLAICHYYAPRLTMNFICNDTVGNIAFPAHVCIDKSATVSDFLMAVVVKCQTSDENDEICVSCVADMDVVDGYDILDTRTPILNTFMAFQHKSIRVIYYTDEADRDWFYGHLQSERLGGVIDDYESDFESNSGDEEHINQFKVECGGVIHTVRMIGNETINDLLKKISKCEGVHKFHTVKFHAIVMNGSAEPEDEPEEEEHEVSATTKALTPYPTSSAPASSEPASSTTPVATLLMWNAEVKFGDLTKQVSFMPNQTVASFRNDLQKVFGIAPKEQKITTAGGEQLMKGAKHMKSYVSSGVKLAFEVRGRGGGKSSSATGASRNYVKSSIMKYKNEQITDNVKEVRKGTEEPNLMKIAVDEAFAVGHDIWEKTNNKSPLDTFYELLSKMNHEGLTKLKDGAFKTNRPEARVARMFEIIAPFVAPKIFELKTKCTAMIDSLGAVFDMLCTGAFATEEGGWEWTKCKEAVKHFCDLKGGSFTASSSSGQVASQTGNSGGDATMG